MPHTSSRKSYPASKGHPAKPAPKPPPMASDASRTRSPSPSESGLGGRSRVMRNDMPRLPQPTYQDSGASKAMRRVEEVVSNLGQSGRNIVNTLSESVRKIKRSVGK